MSAPAPNPHRGPTADALSNTLNLSVFQSLKRNLRIVRALATASFQADLEFRANFISRIVTDIFWYAAQILTFETLYLHTDTIGLWGRDQTRVFLGILFVVDAIYMVLFHDNLDHLSYKVRRGDLDLLLVKPVNSQLMISCQRMATALMGNFMIGLSWLIWSMSQLPDLSWGRMGYLIVLIPCGVVVLYCVRFILSATAVIFTRAEGIQYMWYQLYKLGMRPDSIYRPWLRYLLLSLFPVAVIASVPARALLDPPDFGLFAYVMGLTAVLLYASNRFWRFALTKYVSASS